MSSAAARSRLRVAWRAALCALGVLTIADGLNPPDVSRAHAVSTEVRDRGGVLLRPFLADDGAWRLQTRIEDVSPRYIALLKAYEDRRFDWHIGVDVLAAARAVAQYAGAGHVVSGASTLTMQVARLLYPHRQRGIVTKLVQSARAVQLELRYSKTEILNLYLTLAPFGGNIEGVRAASLVYFGKEPKSLTLAEAALLVALPQSPERARPDRNLAAALAARDKVLARLEMQNVLVSDEAAEARRASILATRLAMPLEAPQMAERLMAAHPSETTIATSLDKTLQAAIAGLASAEKQFLDDGADIAIVVAKTETREVLAELGGTDYWGLAGHVDLASAMRSPGSALKPFIYGFAFDDLSLHPATLIQDEAALFGDYAPKNFDGDFRGTVTAKDALRMSLNVPAVAVLERVGPLRFTLALEHAGAHIGLPGEGNVPSLPVALGGLGISLRDMTMLYAGIADGGTGRPLREIKDTADAPSFRLFGPAAAYYLRDILNGAALPDGWAMGQGLKRTRSIAFKTGTSYGYRDAWAMGFSNDYTVGIWVGRADGAPRADRLGREDAAPILLKVFDLLPADRRVAPSPPADAIIASRSGALPPALRRFTREAVVASAPKARIKPPTIAFPPDGSVVSLPAKTDPEQTIALKAEGGRAPLTWLVNGAVLGSFDRYQAIRFAPDGAGFARLTVIDADGRSATARVRFNPAR